VERGKGSIFTGGKKGKKKEIFGLLFHKRVTGDRARGREVFSRKGKEEKGDIRSAPERKRIVSVTSRDC